DEFQPRYLRAPARATGRATAWPAGAGGFAQSAEAVISLPASLSADSSETHMSKNIPLTLACGDYEIVRALKDGTVKADGIDLTMLTAMDSSTRHWRFLRNQDFDAAEVSASGYLAARDRGHPFVAIPVFLHRRFRHGFIFINTTKGITTPKD